MNSLSSSSFSLPDPQGFDNIAKQKSLTPEDAELIFRAEHATRSDPKQVELHEKLVDLIKRWKDQITARPEHRVLKLAADVKAGDSLEVIQRISKDRSLLPGKEPSLQLVYVVTGEKLQTTEEEEAPKGAVIKKMGQRSLEEEKLYYDLMSIKTSSGLVGSLKVQKVGNIPELTDVQVKPLIENMHLMAELSDEPFFNKILDQLTDDAIEAALINGELQPLDLHEANIGLRQLPSSQMPAFNHIAYSTDGKEWHAEWKEIQLAHYNGKLKDDTRISVDGEQYTVGELPWIKEALDMPWEFVFFDNDKTFEETNDMLKLSDSFSQPFHITPIHSSFLTIPWKDKPLSNALIDRLLQTDDKDQQMRDYLAKTDAPFRRWLSANDLEELDEQLMPHLEKFQLTPEKDKVSANTMQELKQKFVKRLINLDYPESELFWDFLQKKLPASLNYKLTDKEGLGQREAIAAQLFPRATVKQQDALIDRQDHTKAYLNAYRDLIKSSPQERKEMITNFLFLPSCPIDTIKREQYEKQVVKGLPDDLGAIYQDIISHYQPTYFNLMAVMYPNLADNYRLELAMTGDPFKAATAIGMRIRTLEELIREIKNKYPPSTKRRGKKKSDELLLAEHLEAKIKSEKS